MFLVVGTLSVGRIDMDSRLGNLSFTGCGIGRDNQLASRRISGGRGQESCGCCGANCVPVKGIVCSTCRRQGSDPWQSTEWKSQVAAAIAKEPRREVIESNS